MGHRKGRAVKGERRKALARLVAGVAALIVVLMGSDLLGRVVQPATIHPSLQDELPAAVVVTLDPQAGAFHLRELQRIGALGRRLDENSHTLVRPNRETIEWLSRQFWVDDVRPE